MNKKFVVRAFLAVLTVITAISMLGGLIPPQATVSASAPQQAQSSSNAKYVFLFIGDGMAVSQRNAAELYKATLTGATTGTWQETKLLMNTLPAQGMTTTYDAGAIITDSASAGTAMATGQKTLSGVISMDVTKKIELETIAEVAHDKGWKVGIVTSVSLDHATPAVFYAHNSSRSNMYAIGEDLVKSGFDYFAGGSLAQRKGKDGSLLDNFLFAKAAGYTIVEGDKAAFEKLSATEDGKVIAVNSVLDKDAAMPYAMDTTEGEISLAEFTSKGIELLDNPTGFFMMVEGGKIDWSCHANDALATIEDTLAFDDAIAEAYKFYEAHPDETVIIVTGDHETGGMTIGYAGTAYTSFFNKLENQTVSYQAFDAKLAEFKEAKPGAAFTDVVPLIEENFGLIIYPAQEIEAMNALVKTGSAADATDADKAAGKEAQAKLDMALNDAEVEILKTAFAESMKPAADRSKDNAAYLLYGGYEPLTVKLTTILNNKAGIAWTTYSHTGTPVQTSAIGVGSETFNGFYDNTDIYNKMMQIAGFSN